MKASHLLSPPGQRFHGTSSIVEQIHGIAIKCLGLVAVKVHWVVLTGAFASLPSTKKMMALGI